MNEFNIILTILKPLLNEDFKALILESNMNLILVKSGNIEISNDTLVQVLTLCDKRKVALKKQEYFWLLNAERVKEEIIKRNI